MQERIGDILLLSNVTYLCYFKRDRGEKSEVRIHNEVNSLRFKDLRDGLFSTELSS